MLGGLVHLMCVSCSVSFQILSKEIGLCVGIDSVCLLEVVSGFSCVAILKQKNIFQFLIRNAAPPTFLLGWVMILCGKQ